MGYCTLSAEKHFIFERKQDVRMVEATISRRKAREILLGLLFESEFREDEDYVAIYATSAQERLIPDDPYIKTAYYTICENKDEIDKAIGTCAKGWRTDRLSKMSRSLLRLGVYEMLFDKNIPFMVTINEVVELTKTYDDPKAKSFINGVLNGIKDNAIASGVEKEDSKK